MFERFAPFLILVFCCCLIAGSDSHDRVGLAGFLGLLAALSFYNYYRVKFAIYPDRLVIKYFLRPEETIYFQNSTRTEVTTLLKTIVTIHGTGTRFSFNSKMSGNYEELYKTLIPMLPEDKEQQKKDRTRYWRNFALQTAGWAACVYLFSRPLR